MIRKFEMKDTKRVMQIWLDVNIEAHNFVPGDYWLSNYQSVQEQLLQADIYVYEQDEEIQGFVGMMDDYLAGIFVDKKCRSMGIGKELLECVKQNYPAFSLNVYQKNRRAVDFYLREGLSILSNGVDEDTSETDYTMVWNKEK
ncbi:MAG: N-acetyltransferase [Eubacterium sp.]|nr:N-acetyltransferase [Eubacterium sp.]